MQNPQASYTPTPNDLASQFTKQFLHQYENCGVQTVELGELKIQMDVEDKYLFTNLLWMPHNDYAILRMVDYMPHNAIIGNLTLKGHTYVSLATHFLALSLAAKELNSTELVSSFRIEFSRYLLRMRSFNRQSWENKNSHIALRLVASEVFPPNSDSRKIGFSLNGMASFPLKLSPNVLIPIDGVKIDEAKVTRLRNYYVHTAIKSNSWRSVMLTTNLLKQANDYLYSLIDKPKIYTDFEDVPF